MTETKAKRRWFKFSLRTLLIVVALSAVVTWWLVIYPEQTAKWFVGLMGSNPEEAEKLSESGMWAAMRQHEHGKPYYEPLPRSFWDKITGRAVFTVALPEKVLLNRQLVEDELIGTLIVVGGDLSGPIELNRRPVKCQTAITAMRMTTPAAALELILII